MLPRLDLPPAVQSRKTDGTCINPRDYIATLERVERANRAADPEIPSIRRYLELRDIHAHRDAAR